MKIRHSAHDHHLDPQVQVIGDSHGFDWYCHSEIAPASGTPRTAYSVWKLGNEWVWRGLYED